MCIKKCIFLVYWVISINLCLSVRADTLFEMNFHWDKEEVTLGDEITVTIETIHDKDYRLLPLPERLNFPPFEVKRVEHFGPHAKAAAVKEGYRIILTVFELGQFKIPKFAVSFLDSEGKTGQVLTEEFRIEVVSVGRNAGDTNEIRAIKDVYIFHPSLDPVELVGILIPVLIALLIGILVLKRFIAGKRQSSEAMLSPYERAMARLKKLSNLKFKDELGVKMYYESLSSIVRKYFFEEHHTSSGDSTTNEFLAYVSEINFSDETQSLLKKFLEFSDFVKFAKFIPHASERQESLVQARRVIELNGPIQTDPNNLKQSHEALR